MLHSENNAGSLGTRLRLLFIHVTLLCYTAIAAVIDISTCLKAAMY